MFYCHNKFVQRRTCTKYNKVSKIEVFPQTRLKISVSGIWNLGCSTCSWMDHWVCDTGHAFNQTEIAEWPAGPGRSRRSVWFHGSHNYQSSSLPMMQGQEGLYSLVWSTSVFSTSYSSNTRAAHSTQPCCISSDILAFLMMAFWSLFCFIF